MAYEIRHTRRVQFHETDAAGIIFFANYFKWMDEMEGEFFRSLNLPGPLVDHWGATGKYNYDWTVVKATCEYKKIVVFDDVIETHVWVKRKGTKSLTFTFSFSKNGEEVARGEKIDCCTSGLGDAHKGIPLPDYIAQRIEQAPWETAEAGR
ncbi:MAG: acyl-CoA thioesterase [Candidatus Tectomicrobia bacterium]|nr:acyl-CoA thioesterase [Candidatus Tectomicrobia bacterium]